MNDPLPILAPENNIPLKIIKWETREQAQKSPGPATIFSAFYNGKFLTTDMGMCVGSRFAKIVGIEHRDNGNNKGNGKEY